MTYNILIVEDEKKMNTLISDYLTALGFSTKSVYDGLSALNMCQKEEPDLIVLDIMIPGIDGLAVVRRIREYSKVPIIILTAKASEADKLIGLELGADDYVIKPFSMKELAARIRALLRRTVGVLNFKNNSLPSLITHKDIKMDLEKRKVTRNGKKIVLTSVQFDILKTMLEHPGRVFTRKELLLAFQESSFAGYERTIDVHIKNIRKALERDPNSPDYIITVWGVGYKINQENEDR